MGSLFSTATPEAHFLTPRVMPTGDHLFRFTHDWRSVTLKALCLPDAAAEETYVQETIAAHLAHEQWCLNGWEIVSRKIVDGPPVGTVLVIEGKCR